MSQPIRFVVTGLKGQIVQSLVKRARTNSDVEVIALGRPHLNLVHPESIAGIMRAASPDIIVSAAAYTAVDDAENDPETAFVVNSRAPQELARVAESMAIPIIHLSTDYVFDGTKTTPYVEADTVAPLGVYGASKLNGERLVATATANHAILRTAWIYSSFGRNFVRTMLHSAEGREEVAVVADQIGNPTSAADLATAIIGVGRRLLTSDDPELRGIFHLAGAGEASWADFAEEIFKASKPRGGGRLPRSNVSQQPTTLPLLGDLPILA